MVVEMCNSIQTLKNVIQIHAIEGESFMKIVWNISRNKGSICICIKILQFFTNWNFDKNSRRAQSRAYRAISENMSGRDIGQQSLF